MSVVSTREIERMAMFPMHFTCLVSASDSDITIASSDGVLFKVHRRNLEMHSEGFPGEEMATLNEVVNLTETSTTLELLFQYMYRQPQPDLEKVPFTVLAPLAEAAEKYRVFSAIEICKIYMRCVSFDGILFKL